MEFIHTRLPKGAFRPRWEVEWHKLLPRKKRAYPPNLELRWGYRHLVWSRYAQVFYERVIDEHTLDENLLYYSQAGWLYLWPDEDTLEEIRSEMESQELDYIELMFRRQNELEYYRRNNSPPTGNADQYWLREHKRAFQMYLKKPKS